MSGVDEWNNTTWENDYIACPRCTNIVSYDEFTQDKDGPCCPECHRGWNYNE